VLRSDALRRRRGLPVNQDRRWSTVARRTILHGDSRTRARHRTRARAKAGPYSSGRAALRLERMPSQRADGDPGQVCAGQLGSGSALGQARDID
jgi:hypothetical protein